MHAKRRLDAAVRKRNVTLASIDKKDEVSCIKEMREAFHGHSFNSITDLTNKVNMFNTKMFKKFEDFKIG